MSGCRMGRCQVAEEFYPRERIRKKEEQEEEEEGEEEKDREKEGRRRRKINCYRKKGK